MRACSTCSVEKTLTPSHHHQSPIQGSVTDTYRTRFSTTTVQLTWTRTRAGSSLSLSINTIPIPIPTSKGTFSCPLTTKSSVAGISWDFSSAKYGLGPEPLSDFYVVVIIDKEIAVTAGDRSRVFLDGFNSDGNYMEGEFRMVRRRVQVVGRAVYSTRARFYEVGKEHEIRVRFEGEVGMGVYVDERRVVEVRRLRWNFRGKETVFVDGLPVDVMWDLMRWLFPEGGGGGGGGAVLLFQTRAAARSRLWLEGEREEEEEGFSLLVQICM